MATNRFRSKAASVAQVNTVTPTAANSAVYTLTINSKTVTYTADGSATVAEITAGLVAAWNASLAGEAREITAADGTTVITLTSDTPGTPFTQTSSASAGALSTSTTTANSSPNDNNDALNWSDGIPDAADDVVLDAGGIDQSIWWNLDALAAIALTSFTRRKAFTGKVGLPEYNTDGTPYFEYRPTEYQILATTMTIEQPASDEVEHLKFNVGATQQTLTILGEGAAQLGSEQMWWRGTHASNVVNVVDGSLAIASKAGHTAVVATLRAENATVRCGLGTTLTTVSNVDSTVEVNSNVTTLNQTGTSATTYVKGVATLGTGNISAGTLVYQSSGTITTLTPGPNAVIDFSQAAGAVTITNQVTFPAGCTFLDPAGRVVFTNGYKLGAGVSIGEVTLDLGKARTFTVA